MTGEYIELLITYLSKIILTVLRGADTIKMYQLFEKLRVQASNRGGQVVSHLGNHEYMNLIGMNSFHYLSYILISFIGDWRYSQNYLVLDMESDLF